MRFLILFLFIFCFQSFAQDNPGAVPLNLENYEFSAEEINDYWNERQNMKTNFYQRQGFVAVGNFLKNAATSPLRLVRTIGRRHRTRDVNITNENIFMCRMGDELKVYETEFVNNVRKIKKALCSPWPNSTAGGCSCEEVCPSDIRILYHKNYKSPEEQSYIRNQLYFRNWSGIDEEESFDNHSNYALTGGFCWGHTVTTQRFNRLGFFDKNAVPLDKNGKPIPVTSKKFEQYYKDLVDDIVKHNKPRVIPGFENLYELSKTAPFNKIIGNRVAQLWTNNATKNMQGAAMAIRALTRLDDQTKSRVQKTVEDITSRLDLGISPAIVFNKDNKMNSGHVVKVSAHYKNENGDTVLCIQDNGARSSLNQVVSFESLRTGKVSVSCSLQLIVTADGSMKYNGSKLAQLNIVHNEDQDLKDQIKNLQLMCKRRHCQ